MAHEIYEGKAFYSRNTPAWHQKGYVNREGLPMSIDDILAATDTDYIYSLEPYTATIAGEDGPDVMAIPGKRLVVRQHPTTLRRSYIGTVGERFKLHTVRELDGLNQTLMDMGLPVETYGLLGERGQRAFLTYQLPASVTVGAADESHMYLFASTAFDGSASTLLRTTAVRVVCANTYALADSESQQRAAIRHTSVLRGQVQAVREQLEIAFQQADELQALADSLVATTLREDDIDEFLRELFPAPAGAEGSRAEAGAAARREAVLGLLDAPTNVEWKGTAWGMFNAVTEWADHHRRARSPESRALRVMDGRDGGLKARALELLTV